MTVMEFATEHKHDDMGFWLCPNIVKNTSITQVEHKYGVEVGAAHYIPEALRDKKVVKTWREDGLWCIIWYNEDPCVPL